jgi:hypothetical protein
MMIEPYKKVGQISLAVTADDLLLDLGEPSIKSINCIGLLEFDFGSKVFRFDSSGALEEVTFESDVIELESESIPFKYLAVHVKKWDAAMFEKFGFIISPKFGLAFDPEHSPWVTVLTKKSLASWVQV